MYRAKQAETVKNSPRTEHARADSESYVRAQCAALLLQGRNRRRARSKPRHRRGNRLLEGERTSEHTAWPLTDRCGLQAEGPEPLTEGEQLNTAPMLGHNCQTGLPALEVKPESLNAYRRARWWRMMLAVFQRRLLHEQAAAGRWHKVSGRMSAGLRRHQMSVPWHCLDINTVVC